ncbi:hypothetical protein E2C01_034850 [Portunus trituberculatus]|uniref:Uncharacterized protein n=1 Tax=Portunus trituberculatus TaxID=210409 RepID=A0A5B7F3X8_PORTR|nr:hypothetical protein [Portunus trituberculatus]
MTGGSDSHGTKETKLRESVVWGLRVGSARKGGGVLDSAVTECQFETPGCHLKHPRFLLVPGHGYPRVGGWVWIDVDGGAAV